MNLFSLKIIELVNSISVTNDPNYNQKTADTIGMLANTMLGLKFNLEESEDK